MTLTTKPFLVDLIAQLMIVIPTLAEISDGKGMNKHHIDVALNGKFAIVKIYNIQSIETALSNLVRDGILTKDSNNYYHKV